MVVSKVTCLQTGKCETQQTVTASLRSFLFSFRHDQGAHYVLPPDRSKNSKLKNCEKKIAIEMLNFQPWLVTIELNAMATARARARAIIVGVRVLILMYTSTVASREEAEYTRHREEKREQLTQDLMQQSPKAVGIEIRLPVICML